VDELHLDDRPAPPSAEVALAVTTGLAAALVVPSIAWLLRLTDVGLLAGEGNARSSDARLAALQAAGTGPALAPGPDEPADSRGAGTAGDGAGSSSAG
jgi:hypothetical protein